MPAIRKLDWVAVEEIVAGKAAGWSDREIAAALGVSHTTVSRRIRSDIELFGRRPRPGWTVWGSDLTREPQIQGVVSAA